jgi:hypothetical protein
VESHVETQVSTSYKVTKTTELEYHIEYLLETHSITEIVERLEREVDKLKRITKLLLLEEID